MPKPAICKNCINFMIYENDVCTCDYEYWEEVPLLQAVLHTPTMFGCADFEYSIEIQENEE